MRIAYLTTSFVPSVAANSVQVVEMCSALAELGHEVTLYAVEGPVDAEPFGYYGVPPGFALQRASREVAGGAPRRVGAAAYVARQLRHLWSQPAADLYFARAARLLLGVAARGRPLRYEAHVLPAPGPRRAVQRALFALPNFDRLVCISDALARDYADAFPGVRERIVVAHDAARPLPAVPAALDRQWPGRPGATQVGYVGGIYPGRGVETLVEAAGELPGVDFQIIGGNPAAVAEWHARCALPNVHFWGHVPRAMVPAVYARLDVLTAPFRGSVSVHGGAGDTSRWMSPLKIFEYMSAGRAIVCGDFPVLREVLRDGDNAILLPGEDAAAWTRAIAELDSDPAMRARLGASALADFEAHHTWRSRAEAVIAGVAQRGAQ